MSPYGVDPRIAPGALPTGGNMPGAPAMLGRGGAPSVPAPGLEPPPGPPPPPPGPMFSPRAPAPTQYGGPPGAPNPTPGSPGMPVSMMALMGGPPMGGVPEVQTKSQQPQPGYPAGDRMHTPYGQNGFGLHPDTTPNDMVDYLMPKVKSVESSGDPTNYIGKSKNLPYDPKRGSASGLFGYQPDTWGNYKGYPRAMDAPPEIQEEKFRKDMSAALLKFGGDPFKAVANHYYPAHAHDPTKWDTTIPGAGTVNGYLGKVFNAGPDKAGDRHARYIQGANANRQSTNNQTSVQLP